MFLITEIIVSIIVSSLLSVIGIVIYDYTINVIFHHLISYSLIAMAVIYFAISILIIFH